jgi:hypothetical protein
LDAYKLTVSTGRNRAYAYVVWHITLKST